MAESYPLKPSLGLARELNKVEEAANALNAVMGVQNYRPPEFPENALNAMLAGLVGIGDVSVDGADDVLRAAMRRLPSYTTDYLQDLDDVDDDEEHGAWVRDGEIELSFDKLIGAATKALHEVNKQKQQLGTEEPLPERAIDNALDDVTTHEAINLLIEADDGLKELHKAAKETLPDTEINENFERRIWDAKSVNNMSLSELRHPKFVQGWPEKLRKASIRASKKAETALEKLYNGPAKHLDNFRERVKKAPAKTIIETAEHANKAFGNWLEQLGSQVTALKQEQIPHVDPEIQKAAEEEAERLLSKNLPVPDDIALNVRDLELTNTDFFKIGLLGNLDWLQSFKIDDESDPGNSKVYDVSIFYHLKNLKNIWMRGVKVKDITALERLSKLSSLDLAFSQLDNIDVLGNFKNLKTLGLDYTQVNDINILKKLTKLKTLGLEYTQVSDIGALGNLVNLRSLWLNGSEVHDIAALKNLKDLEELGITRTPVSDISVLKNLKGLRTLGLRETKISDFRVLENLTHLQVLGLGGTKIRRLNVLETLTNLQLLYLNNTKVSDISALEKLNGLQELDLTNTQVTDWSAVAHVEIVHGRPDNWDSND